MIDRDKKRKTGNGSPSLTLSQEEFAMIDRDKKRKRRARIQEATKYPISIELARAAATQWGYHRFDILVVPANTIKVIGSILTARGLENTEQLLGELVIESIPTARRPENVEQLIEEIREVASLPKELWAKVKHKSPEFGETDIRKVLDGQCLGGHGRDEELGYREVAERILAIGTQAAYDSERHEWAKKCNRELSSQAKNTFCKAMHRYGVRKSKLRK